MITNAYALGAMRSFSAGFLLRHRNDNSAGRRLEADFLVASIAQRFGGRVAATAERKLGAIKSSFCPSRSKAAPAGRSITMGPFSRKRTASVAATPLSMLALS